VKKLFPVQESHLAVILKALFYGNAALDGSVTGAGKTLVACNAVKEMKRPAVVVCPKVSIPMWERELEEQGCDYYGAINYEMLRTGKTPYGTWAHKIWQWKLPENTMLVFDECQRAKGWNSQNAKIMWSSKRYTTLMLSASAAKDPTEMKALGYLLGLHNLRDFWKWALRNGCSHGYFGGLEFSGTPEDIDRLHKEIFPDHGSRLTFTDMAEYFQATEVNMTPLDFGPEVKEAYEHMAAELAELEQKKAADSSGAEALTIRLRARQKVELLKVPYMVEQTFEFLSEGRSVVLFVNFSQTLEALRSRISSVYDVGIIAGIDIKNRQKYIDAFADDQLRVMLCNVQAGGVSVNLHDRHGKYPRVSIISPSDNEKDVLQCVGRIHRAGGATPTQQHILFAANTIEEEVKENCETKLGRIEIFNDGLDKPNESDKLILQQ
jgi:superfamily II DNA or RNA helicase